MVVRDRDDFLALLVFVPREPDAIPVWLKYYVASRGLAMIVAEQATNCPLLRDQVVVETLMIPLGMIVSEVLVDHVRQRGFAQHHHALQSFLLDGAHESFAVGVEIRPL